jgi:hypothetical protein
LPVIGSAGAKAKIVTIIKGINIVFMFAVFI